MKQILFFMVLFVIFAVVYPKLTLVKMSQDQVYGYRIGMLGAAVILGTFLAVNYFFPSMLSYFF